jgi:hypothetical protein
MYANCVHDTKDLDLGVRWSLQVSAGLCTFLTEPKNNCRNPCPLFADDAGRLPCPCSLVRAYLYLI